MATSTRLTIEDFEKLPAEAVKHRELVDGELIDVSGNNLGHNRLRDLLVRLLAPLVEQQKLGEMISEQEYDFDGNAHGPDVSFVSTSKVPLLDRNLEQKSATLSALRHQGSLAAFNRRPAGVFILGKAERHSRRER